MSGERIKLHWTINGLRNDCRWRRKPHPFGLVQRVEKYDSEVRVLVPDHTFVVASRCRVERDNWHNRIHHALVRYVATRRGAVMEYGGTACSRFLVDPLYIDEPLRLCDCGNGEATICPGCEIVVHRGLPGCLERAA